jgi:hypothetical protein
MGKSNAFRDLKLAHFVIVNQRQRQTTKLIDLIWWH